jgi:aminoglycoside phosphotransferase (APT) family kinase protein
MPTTDADRVQGLIDPEKLARWMDAQKLPGAGSPVEARFVTGGASNELFEIRRGDARMALRRPPRKVPKGRNETMMREYRVLAALRDTDVPHSRVLGACDDPDVVGASFYVMEFVDGWSPMSTPGQWPAPFDGDLEARRGLAFELVDGIAKLARVDWRAHGLEGFGKPEGFHERQVDRWLAHLAACKIRELPGLDDAAAWLRTHKPSTWRPGIIHGDYQFANVMFRHVAPARLAAIVDWEMATIGDPLMDLGTSLSYWAEANDPATFYQLPSGHAKSCSSATAPLPPADERYYVILGRFKLAIVLEAGYARYVQGGADNPKMALFGDVVLDLAKKAGELARTTTL